MHVKTYSHNYFRPYITPRWGIGGDIFVMVIYQHDKTHNDPGQSSPDVFEKICSFVKQMNSQHTQKSKIKTLIACQNMLLQLC